MDYVPRCRAVVGHKFRCVTESVPALEEAGKSFRCHIYPEAQHAFFNDTQPTYNAEASREACTRTLNFLRDALH